MSSLTKCLDEMIESKLLNLHTAYLARVISVSGNTAKIQPLGNVKAYGENAQSQSPLSSVPIIWSARNKMSVNSETVLSDVSLNLKIEKAEETNVTDVSGDLTKTPKTISTVQITPITAGDIVICVCCERDISSAKSGNNGTPAANSRHSMSNSIIVGVL